MAKKEKKALLKEAFNFISKEEVGKIMGGLATQTMATSVAGKTPIGITTTHCVSGSADCFCEPHCIMGKDCTSNWG